MRWISLQLSLLLSVITVFKLLFILDITAGQRWCLPVNNIFIIWVYLVLLMFWILIYSVNVGCWRWIIYFYYFWRCSVIDFCANYLWFEQGFCRGVFIIFKTLFVLYLNIRKVYWFFELLAFKAFKVVVKFCITVFWF